MVTLSRDAQGDLERYLRQVKAALRGHGTVDADDVERDVRGHIDAELAGETQPIDRADLQRVLQRLGAPDEWVPQDDLPSWRRVLNRLRAGPEDWRLAYLSLGLFVLGPIWFFASPSLLWPLPVLLVIVSFLFARASLALLDEHDEPVGARRWLIYPPLVPWYLALAVVLLAWPLPPAVGAVAEDSAIHARIGELFPGPFWLVAASLAILAVGTWWLVLGFLLGAFTNVVQGTFWPFADWFGRRHATRLTLVGFILAAGAGVILMIAR
jgi:hypothetical protein